MDGLVKMRSFIYQTIFIEGYKKAGISAFNLFMGALIILGVTVSILDTEKTVTDVYGSTLRNIEVLLAAFFAIEYCLRLWAAGEDDRYKGVIGRLKYMFTFFAVIDLLAFLPTLLVLGSTDTLLLRLFRLARLVRFAKLGRYSSSLRLIISAFISCWRELVISFMVAMFLLVGCSVFLYLIEGNVQPELFGSIPRAMWCAVSTLTTFGYGDVYPVTALGQVFMGFAALTGIGLVGMPTAILAGAFSDQFEKRRMELK
jgi:voltage-gated potassium channel